MRRADRDGRGIRPSRAAKTTAVVGGCRDRRGVRRANTAMAARQRLATTADGVRGGGRSRCAVRRASRHCDDAASVRRGRRGDARVIRVVAAVSRSRVARIPLSRGDVRRAVRAVHGDRGPPLLPVWAVRAARGGGRTGPCSAEGKAARVACAGSCGRRTQRVRHWPPARWCFRSRWSTPRRSSGSHSAPRMSIARCLPNSASGP